MNKIVISILVTVVVSFFSSCSIEPSPINYGMDACHFCKMNIVDKQHGAELVTEKGKVFKYDAVECLLRDLNKQKTAELLLVNTYNTPIELNDANLCTYLISENLPSPMGGNLTAFLTKEAANKTLKERGGDLFSWEELKVKYAAK